MPKHLAVIAALAVLPACERPAPNLTPVAEPWSEVRASLTTGERCFAKSPEYCLADPAFLDPVIQSVLDRKFDGAMPTTRDGVDSVTRSVGSPYRTASQTPEAVALVQALVDARYSSPVITVDGTTVTADYGHVAGPLRVQTRHGVNMAPSPNVDGSQWASTEVGPALLSLSAGHPQAALLQLKILIPGGSSSPRQWTYTYKPASKRIRVQKEHDRSYSVGPIPTLEAIGPETSVHTRDLSSCSQNPKGGGRRPACEF